jgi:ADP-dependent NAD(P)H-hydrate dehydratase / NAD(P)H-hydrate epimerase
MNPEFWHKQLPTKPLFPELEWSRPENRQMAGKLLIVGGNLHGFAAPAEAYNETMKAGIGANRVLLPSAIQKVVGPSIENGEFAASTPSGSFSQRALVELLDWCRWADGVLFAGDLGRNSETAIMVEKFLQKCEAITVLTKDAVDYAISLPQAALERPNTTLVLSLSQLQRLGIAAKFEKPITFSMGLVQLLEWLHAFTSRFACHIIVKHLDQIFVAVNGEISTTKLVDDKKVWRLKTASHAIVWWVQNNTKTFEALTTAVAEVAKPGSAK